MAQHSDKHSFVQVSYTCSSILFTGYNCDHSRVSFPVFTFKNPPLDFLTPSPVHLRLPTDYHKHVQSIVPFTTTIVPHFILGCTIPGRYFFTSILCKIPGLKFTSLRHHPCHLSLAGPIFYLPHSHISFLFGVIFFIFPPFFIIEMRLSVKQKHLTLITNYLKAKPKIIT